VRTLEPHWLHAFERSGDRHLGQTLVRLARLAESLHHAMAAEYGAAPGPLTGETDQHGVGTGDAAAPAEDRRLGNQGMPR
jgi:hypothetical protein